MLHVADSRPAYDHLPEPPKQALSARTEGEVMRKKLSTESEFRADERAKIVKMIRDCGEIMKTLDEYFTAGAYSRLAVHIENCNHHMWKHKRRMTKRAK